MEWLTVGACSLLALFAFYALYTHNDNPNSKKEDQHVQVLQAGTDDTLPFGDQNSPPRLRTSKAESLKAQIASAKDSPAITKTNSRQNDVSEEARAVAKKDTQDYTSAPNVCTKDTLPPSFIMPPPTVPSRTSSPQRLRPPTFSQPPRPSGKVRPPPSAASSLRVPPQKALPGASMIPSSSLGVPQRNPSRQVTLEPGHSPLDWADLTKDPRNNLRGKDAPTNLMKITPSVLKVQNGRKGKDAWTSYQGRVYNITPYLPFHPGGEGEIMRGAGKDSAKLFMETHPWVNWDGMLAECLVGILVSEAEDEVTVGQNLDEMD